MVKAVPDILARIVDQKRRELPALKSRVRELEKMLAARLPVRNFRAALEARRPAIIAEIKKASPSKGVFQENFDPAAIARSYTGAAALSVLTDRDFFQGSLADLQAARAAVEIPVLRKDFTLDPIHVIEAVAHGADAVLLIAAVLDVRELMVCREQASTLGLAAIVEVHDEDELEKALKSRAEIIGVNNRDLRTFEVHLETSLRLAERIPDSVLKVSESGIQSREDVQRLMSAGYHAFLVGEHLMKSADPAAALRALQ